MIENFWKDKYPAGIAAEINPDQYPNILSVLKESCQRFATKPAFTNLGKTLTYGELYKLSGDFAAYLQQHTDLKPGDRIAVQLPNVLQYPIVVFGAMRAGLIVVNTNPLYTARELEHQFNDSGAKAVVCLANMAHLVEGVLPKTGVKQVIVTEVGDILPPLKRFIVNFVVKHIKKMVPAYSLPQATKLTDALARGAGKSFQEAAPQADDVAVLQYTGGTTGVAKGRHADPPQPGGQHVAVQGADGRQPQRGLRDPHRAAAAVPHLCLHLPLHGDDAHRQPQHPDHQPARPAVDAQGPRPVEVHRLRRPEHPVRRPVQQRNLPQAGLLRAEADPLRRHGAATGHRGAGRKSPAAPSAKATA